MKSITEQASSVFKALQKGWERAGKPTEFSVKIFEEAQTNFFGFTTQQAKVGIFFETAAEPQQPGRQQTSQSHSPQKPPARHAHQQRPQRQSQPARQRDLAEVSTKPETYPSERHSSKERAKSEVSTKADRKEAPVHHQQQRTTHQNEPREIWNEALLDQSKEWLDEVLKAMGGDYPAFTLKPDGYDLTILFKKQFIPDINQQQQLYRSFSTLLMQTLRHKMRRPLRGFRMVFTHES